MSKVIQLNHITKIEGHANLKLKIDKGRVKKCELSAIEGSRYFEGILNGRRWNEAHEMSSRICGICSCAHTLCALKAIENAFGIAISEQTYWLRTLLNMGERIRSNATHLYFLALPDYLGYESGLQMLPKYKKEINDALALIKLGNEFVRTVGGRAIHPVSAAVGGFLKIPEKEDLQKLKKDAVAMKKVAVGTANIIGRLNMPRFERETSYVSLHHYRGYAMLHGDIKADSSIYKQKDFTKYIDEYHEPHSTANFVVKEGRSYMVGALARINNNFKQLSEDARAAAEKHNITFPNSNPFINNFAQALELIHCIDITSWVIDQMDLRQEKPKSFDIAACQGIAALEAPRGMLIHEYNLDNNGVITHANIITPTVQNLRQMQDDIKAYVPQILKYGKKKTVFEIEKLIRAYDPCFSCSTHFLDVEWE